jgi:hypothetical protein
MNSAELSEQQPENDSSKKSSKDPFQTAFGLLSLSMMDCFII